MATRPTKPQQSPSVLQPSPEAPAAEPTVAPAVAPAAVEQAEIPENPLLQALAALATQTQLFKKLSGQADTTRSISFDLLAGEIGDDQFIAMLDGLQLQGRDSFPETEWRAIVTLHDYMVRHKLSDPRRAIARITQPENTVEPEAPAQNYSQSHSNGNGNSKAGGNGSALLPQQAQQAMQQGLGKLQRQIRQQGTEIGVQLGFTMLDTVADTAAATVYAALSRELGDNAPQHLKDRHEQTKQKFAALDEVVRGAFTRPQSGGEYGSQYLQDGLEEGEEVLPLSAEIANLFSQESTEPLFSFNGL